MQTIAFLVVASLLCGAMAGLNLYQAVTGRRVSSAPSRRDRRTLRRQSAVAAVTLGLAAVFWLTFAVYQYCYICIFSS